MLCWCGKRASDVLDDSWPEGCVLAAKLSQAYLNNELDRMERGPEHWRRNEDG